MQNVHFVRQKAAIQFNPMVDIGRRKMNEIWRDYSSTYAHIKELLRLFSTALFYSSELLNFANA